MSGVVRWAPGSILSVGVLLTLGLGPQKSLDLRAPLETVVPRQIDGVAGQDIPVTEAEARVAGFDDYLLRSYGTGPEAYSVYVGYYGSQTKGHTIHSPKNCLPGAGWEALTSQVETVSAADGRIVEVNRYVLQRGEARALVLYWYQGRGRVAHNEYMVKWDLLRDAALRQRSDEALVRIVVPMISGEQDALRLASEVAADLVPAVDLALPL